MGRIACAHIVTQALPETMHWSFTTPAHIAKSKAVTTLPGRLESVRWEMSQNHRLGGICNDPAPKVYMAGISEHIQHSRHPFPLGLYKSTHSISAISKSLQYLKMQQQRVYMSMIAGDCEA